MKALALIQHIYTVEAIIKKDKLGGDEKTAMRKGQAMPMWELLKQWCASEIMEVPQDTLIYKAMNCSLRREQNKLACSAERRNGLRRKLSSAPL